MSQKRKTQEEPADVMFGLVDREDILSLYDWNEWCSAKEMLESSSRDDMRAGLGIVARWRVSVGVSVAIDATAALVEAMLLDLEREDSKKEAALYEQKEGISDACICNITMEQVTSKYSLAILRMVNGLTSEVEKKYGKLNRTVMQMSRDIQLPLELVDIRHAATHHSLPGIHELRIGTSLGLDYLSSFYWRPQQQSMLRFVRHQQLSQPTKISKKYSQGSHHPFILSEPPSPVGDFQKSSTQQLLQKLESECQNGILSTLSGLEKDLGISSDDATLKWSTAKRCVADIRSSTAGVAVIAKAVVT
eukprot:TRINITY_DN26005_c0_g1_i1.p1 TRINITY_DN26005_c0_g1~~TRINITY_DN26005_c0_g1_i1.p1  ORF type:complete len:305 (+),score=72.01 TRINITY_DN26005_c0_g1_i1:64-978(+)